MLHAPSQLVFHEPQLCQTRETVRVVLDTNILISACWKPGGLEAQAVALALDGTITACISSAVWAEYRDVLARKKFISLQARADEMLAALEKRTLAVDPTEALAIASDEDDNRFLECAAAANAAYLITGNLKHYPQECGGTKIV